MWESIATVLLLIVKKIFEKDAGRKLNLENFIEHIRAHQVRHSKAAQAAEDSDSAIEDILKDEDKKE